MAREGSKRLVALSQTAPTLDAVRQTTPVRGTTEPRPPRVTQLLRAQVAPRAHMDLGLGLG